ncbi:MAG TPA: DUF3325 domain-containing protein [Cellvibrio sp.]|nr:DUF3325 domain-containing protein [Cellvibrio sp.]
MLLAFALAYITCLSLSLAMNRHFQQVLPARVLSARLSAFLRNSGWLLLLLTVIYCAKLSGVAVGLVLAVGLFSAAACLLSLLLNYAPKSVLPLAASIPVVAFI